VFFQTVVWLEGIIENHSRFESVRRKSDDACCFHLVWEGYPDGPPLVLQDGYQGDFRYDSREGLQYGCW
jgi:hypothetical protein